MTSKRRPVNAFTCNKVRLGSRRAVHWHNRSNSKRIRAYFCKWCNGWHATTEPVETRRRGR